MRSFVILTWQNGQPRIQWMGRVKVGTSLDAELLRQAQEHAARHKVPLNTVLEQALSAYLQRERGQETDLVARTFGSVTVPRQILDEILAEDIYDA